jgi:hypothetical protein
MTQIDFKNSLLEQVKLSDDSKNCNPSGTVQTLPRISQIPWINFCEIREIRG